MNRMVALWAHPRSRSTVLERVFIERGDFEVFHEPFAHMAFDERSAIPQDNLDCGLPRTYAGIRALLRDARERSHVFHKDMCYHCLDALKADTDFLMEQQNVFIIRDPGSAILSHYAVYPEMPLDAIGHRAQYEVFCLLTRLSGRIPYVINADDLASRPAETVARLCDHLGLPFMPNALHWERECPPQWLPWRRWHRDVEKSTGIVAQNTDGFDREALNRHPRLTAYYRFHRPFYERMNQFIHTTQ